MDTPDTYDANMAKAMRATLEIVVRNIEGFLDGTWDGNAEGWQALCDRIHNTIAKPEA